MLVLEKVKPQLRPSDRWREYELRKAEWRAEHPEATHQDYEQAMQRISRECGV